MTLTVILICGELEEADMETCNYELLHPLTERGYGVRVVSAEHASSLQEEVDRRYRQGEFDPEFYEERIVRFRYQFPEGLEDARSLIVVAVPRPQTQASFVWRSQKVHLTIPPTYTGYYEVNKKVSDLIATSLHTQGYRSATMFLPLKLLAARSGLVQYGRNNIAYAEGMGSFFQLVAVCSDMPCNDEVWQEPTMMKACRNCHLCRNACPTGAIPSDRFLLHAERCIVFHSERSGHIAFPDWIDPSWHNCIVGCLHCQKACPLNKEFLEWFGHQEDFSEEETSMLLKGVSQENVPKDTLKKLENLSLHKHLGELPRNLGVLFGVQK